MVALSVSSDHILLFFLAHFCYGCWYVMQQSAHRWVDHGSEGLSRVGHGPTLKSRILARTYWKLFTELAEHNLLCSAYINMERRHQTAHCLHG